MTSTKDSSSIEWLGERLARKEDLRLVTGKGKYLADIATPGTLHAVFVRSEYAHANIIGIDLTEAESLPGVIAIYTGENIKDRINPMPQAIVQPNLPAKYPTFWPLAVGKVTFHGEPVALIIARDKYIAEDASELVLVDYEELPVVLDPEKALTRNSTVVHEKDGTNEIFSMTFTGGENEESQNSNEAEVNAIFDSAPVVVKERFKTHRTGLTPMEPRGVLCD